MKRCETTIVTWNGEDTEERECGLPTCAIVNGFPICPRCRSEYDREGLIETEEDLN